MSEVVFLPKWDGIYGPGAPAWVPCFNPAGEQVRPHIKCMCGEFTNIENHEIHADGRITASYLHKWPDGRGCGWHVFLQMLGWTGGPMQPQQEKCINNGN